MTFATLRLELHHPEVDGAATRGDSWRYLSAVLRDVRGGVQRGLGDVLVLLRDLRASGQYRWATKEEKRAAKDAGTDLPSECWDTLQLKRIQPMISIAVKATGVSEYVYASVAERLASSEFGGSKLRSLLSCASAYPVATSVPISVRSRNCSFSIEDAAPKVRITSLRPGGGPVVLDCCRLHGRGATAKLAIVEKLASGDWAHGAVSIHRRERDGKWYVLVPYDSGKVDAATGQRAAVHRGVAHLITIVTERGEVAHYPGHMIADHKTAYGRRRRLMQQDLAARGGRGRGAKDTWRALRRLEDGGVERYA